MNGKGSKPRKVNINKYNKNYDSIFNKMQNFHESKQFAADDQQVALVDIDETVCAYGEKRRYDLAVPIQKNIDKINKMYDDGWYIIYWTARGGSEKSKAAGRCYYDFTWEQLKG